LEPVLLIHGLFGSLGDRGIVAPIGAARVLAPDLIGYGANRGNTPESWTLEDQADHVAAWPRGHGFGPVHVVRH
jgi:pimeloyl-ACP methyl ester carboxylesterase